MEQRDKKRILVLLAVAAITIGPFFLWYIIFGSKATCFDGKKNQEETGVDCGGPCQKKCPEKFTTVPLAVKEKEIVYGGPDKYDVVVKINNPNNQAGSGNVPYKISLKDSQGNQLGKKEGKTFVYPAQTKYIIVTNFESTTAPSQAEVEFGEIIWKGYPELELPRLDISNKRFSAVPNQPLYGEASGILRNESRFDFNAIMIGVILRDPQGRALAVNTTEIRSVGSREERDFRFVWPYRFPGEVQNIEIEAEVNMFDGENFQSGEIQSTANSGAYR